MAFVKEDYRVITPSLQAIVYMEINPIELWHRRYGHIHNKIILSLSQMVKGIPNIKEDHGGVCKGCALGKNTRKPFTNSNTRSKEILDLTHSDVCGPMSKKLLGGHLYYVTFIDDHSRKTWLYLLKTKDEAFEKFKEFRSKVETLTERKINTLRSDNGGESTSKALIAYCKEASIKRELIVPYIPKQNGVTQRKNRTIE